MNNAQDLQLPLKIGHILHPSDVPGAKLHYAPKPVNVVRYNHSGAYFMSGGNDRKVHLWNSQNGMHVKSFEAHGYEIADIAINADSSQFASCGGDKLLFHWDVRTGVTIRRYAGHYQRLNAVCYAAEGMVLASGSFDATVRLWDTRSQSQAPIQVLQEAKDSVSAVCAYEHTLVTGSLDGKVRTYDLRQGQLCTDVMARIPIYFLVNHTDSRTHQCHANITRRANIARVNARLDHPTLGSQQWWSSSGNARSCLTKLQRPCLFRLWRTERHRRK